ncbi:MAG: hypothetical protein ABI207_06890 [Crocinitomicaceae bacterium]
MKNLALIFGIAALLSSCKQSSFVAEDDVYSTGSSDSKFAGNNSDASYNSYVYSKENSSTKSAYYNPNAKVDTSDYYNPNSSYAKGGNTYINNYYGNNYNGNSGYGGNNYYNNNNNYFNNGWYGYGLMSSSFGYGYGGYGSGYYPHNYYGGYGYNPYGMYGYGMNPYGMYGMNPYGGYGGYGMYGMNPYGGGYGGYGGYGMYGMNPYGGGYGGYGMYGMNPYGGGYGGYGGGYGMNPYGGGQMTTYEMTSSGYYKNGNNYIGHHQYSNATPQSYSSYTPKEKMMVVDPTNSTPINVPNASNRTTYRQTDVVQGQRGVSTATVSPDSKPWKPAIETPQNGSGTVATGNRSYVNPTQNNGSNSVPVNRPNTTSERPVVINRPAVQGSSVPSSTSNSSMDQWRRSEPTQNSQPQYRGAETTPSQPFNRGTQTSSPQPVNRTGTQAPTYSSPRNEGYSSPTPTNTGGSYNRGSGSTYSSPSGGGGYGGGGGGGGGGRPASSSPMGGSTRR